MFNNKTMQAIGNLTDEELLYSKVHHEERFASLHEAESIIREELEEMEEEVTSCRDAFETMHKVLRHRASFDPRVVSEGVRVAAQYAAAEAIQLAAMCKKLDEMYMIDNDRGSGLK